MREYEGSGTYEVESSAIDRVEYDEAAEIAIVYYKNGRRGYDFRVKPNEMRDFLNAPSKGKHVAYQWKRYNTI